jgi:hypothetical protein
MAAEDTETVSSEQMLASAPPALIGGNYSTEFDPTLPRPSRVVFEPINTPSGLSFRKNPRYTGSNRVNAKNRFELDRRGQALGPYDEDRDSKTALYSLDDIERRATLMIVQKILGGRYRPSQTGLDENDFNAFRQVIRQANAMGRTWDVALEYLASRPALMQGGSPRSIRLTSAEDIRFVAQETAIKMLGGALDRRTMQRIIKAIQAEDVRSQQPGTREQAATLAVQVQEEVEKSNPREAMIQGAASIGEIMTKALGGD